jgi:predicted AAA+ superfamily ATPase
MNRSAVNQLIEWKNSIKRKPLLVFGARQVGKTWLIRHFGETHFENFLYVNFEKEISLRTLFEQDYQPKRIIQVLEAFYDKEIVVGKTLLVFDEIQEAKGALTALKYFNEEVNELHIIGAGSLLGIAVKAQTSFPVGQVNFLRLYPMSFHEFLQATGNEKLAQLITQNEWQLLQNLRTKAIELLRQYYFVGGMPEAVQTFVETKNFAKVREIQEAILMAYDNDFSKHASSEIIPRIRMVWNSIVGQLAKENKKFIFGQIRVGARAKDFEMALNWLEDYGLIYRVQRTAKANLPLSAYADLNVFKVYAHDVGLLAAMGAVSPKILIAGDQLFMEFKGAITEQYVVQELKSQGVKNLFYWANDSGGAEVDFILENEQQIIPLEVKASENLQAKSLKIFHNKHPEITCFRTSLSDYREESWMTNLPLYGVAMLVKTRE